ncbi:MAG: RT0821/Lpp0805 family surface protein [Alphaproteobacteria bacterium]
MAVCSKFACPDWWLSTAIAVVALGLFATPPAWADPPPWAPAYGYRDHHDDGEYSYKKKHHKKHRKKRKQYEVHSENDGVIPPAIRLGRCDRERIGTVIGAAAGGLLGANVGKGDGRLVAVGAGTFLGAIVGGALGRSMDEVDAHCVAQSLEYASDGEPIVWRNPDDGARYEVTPIETRDMGGGTYCRRYETTFIIDGRTEIVRGRACREPDGRWRMVE